MLVIDLDGIPQYQAEQPQSQLLQFSLVAGLSNQLQKLSATVIQPLLKQLAVLYFVQGQHETLHHHQSEVFRQEVCKETFAGLLVIKESHSVDVFVGINISFQVLFSTIYLLLCSFITWLVLLLTL